MITSLKLIRNIGSFDSYQGTDDTRFGPLTLIHADNGRGKTTLGAILRSLATGSPSPIEGRRRLDAKHQPQVVIETESPTQTYVYRDGQWSASPLPLVIYDDQFVDDNVYSGLSVAAGHRQKLHEVILGKQGVTLARQVEELTVAIAQLNQSLREQEASIPKKDLHNQDIDTYCNLAGIEGIEKKITEQSKRVDALEKEGAVMTTRFFSKLELPMIDVDVIEPLLAKRLEDLDEKAIARVQTQFETIGREGESWASDGTRYLDAESQQSPKPCPYCGQSVVGVELVDAYRAYFGESYRLHLASINSAVTAHENAFGGDSLATLQQEVSQQAKRSTFWKPLVELPDVAFNEATIASTWAEARDAVSTALKMKQSSPLEPVLLAAEAKAKISRYEEVREKVVSASERLAACNDAITELKQATAGADIKLAKGELDQLRASKTRHSEQNSPKCQAYIDAKTAKSDTERRKQEAREKLALLIKSTKREACRGR